MGEKRKIHKQMLVLAALVGVLLLTWGHQTSSSIGALADGGITAGGSEKSPVSSRTAAKEHEPGTERSLHPSVSGIVLNSEDKQPVQNAVIFHNGEAVRSDASGQFTLNKLEPGQPVLVKAVGYRQAVASIPEDSKLKVELTAFDAKGLYLTHYGVSSRIIRNRVLGLIKESDLNALVLDVKGDRGLLSYKYDVPLASQDGAHKIPTIKDIKAFIHDLHQQNIYVIGRIVTFKDNLLANYKPEWAITDTRTQKPWTDNEGLAWVDPFRSEVWDYNIAIAREAAKAGFDEIQFDYVRFPTDGKLSSARYSQTNNLENRVKTINGFLEAAYKALLPYNTYLSADIFGYVPWNYNDTDIGQRIVDVAQHVDYLCLMVYPSGYHLGIPGYRLPVSHPHEIVYYTLEKAKQRLDGQPKKLRPWLQNFRDYAFDRRPYTGSEIKLQIQACTEANTSGWLLWDPSNKYTYTADAMKALKPGSDQLAGALVQKTKATR
jgi:hypothetical protein